MTDVPTSQHQKINSRTTTFFQMLTPVLFLMSIRDLITVLAAFISENLQFNK